MNIRVLFSHIYALYFVITLSTTSQAYRAMQTENNDHISISINIRLLFSILFFFDLGGVVVVLPAERSLARVALSSYCQQTGLWPGGVILIVMQADRSLAWWRRRTASRQVSSQVASSSYWQQTGLWPGWRRRRTASRQVSGLGGVVVVLPAVVVLPEDRSLAWVASSYCQQTGLWPG